jgi:hypothetical protein
MAEIKIYGTLKNDTGEPIVYASQVTDETTGKTILELLESSGAGSESVEAMTSKEIEDAAADVFGAE